MKRKSILGIVAAAVVAGGCTGRLADKIQDGDDYRDVMEETVKRIKETGKIAYDERVRSWAPYETEQQGRVREYRYVEIDYPEDPYCGSQYVFRIDTFIIAYDGTRRLRTALEGEGYEMDSLFHLGSLTGKARAVGVPFYHCCGRILEYALNPTDSADVALRDEDGSVVVEVTAYPEKGIELIFSMASLDPHIENPYVVDNTSKWTVCIDKNTGLPWKYTRICEYDCTSEEVLRIDKGESEKIKVPMSVYDFVPKGAKVRKIGVDDKVAGNGEGNDGGETSASSSAEMIGKMAPEWTLSDTEGRRHSLGDYRGRWLLIEFTSCRGCGACIKAQPFVSQMSKGREGGIEGLEVVSIDCNNDKEACKRYVENKGVDYTYLVGEKGVHEAYTKFMVTPDFYLVDKEGIVRYVSVGFGNDSTMRREIEKVMRAGK